MDTELVPTKGTEGQESRASAWLGLLSYCRKAPKKENQLAKVFEILDLKKYFIV